MSAIMNASPYENVATKGSRTMAHRARLNALASPTLPGVDAALKAIYVGALQILPAGNSTTEEEFRRQFEARAEVLDKSLRIYENALNTEIGLSLGTLEYDGLWDADTNTPALASGVGVKAHYRVVNVKGNTNLDGISGWDVGDWVIFNGTAWQKIDNSEPDLYERTFQQEMIVPSIAVEDRYRIPVGSLFLDAAGETTLEVDTGSGYTPAVLGVDYVHLRRGYSRPCAVYGGVEDAAIGFRWINGAVAAGWTFRFRWLERRILASPMGVMAVRLDGSGTAIDGSTTWHVNAPASLCNGFRASLLPGYVLEVWRLAKRRGGLNSGGGAVGDGRRYLPYMRNGADNPFVDFQPLFQIGKGKRQFKTCFYNPVTGARSPLCVETIYFQNFTNRDDALGVSGFLRSKEGAVWVI